MHSSKRSESKELPYFYVILNQDALNSRPQLIQVFNENFVLNDSGNQFYLFILPIFIPSFVVG